MTEERIKELAEAIEKELHSMLREIGYNGIRIQQFIAEHISTVAAEAREEGIDEANQVWVNIVKYASGDTLQTVIDEGVEATEWLKEQGK